jgi:hypothetical protein
MTRAFAGEAMPGSQKGLQHAADSNFSCRRCCYESLPIDRMASSRREPAELCNKYSVGYG